MLQEAMNALIPQRLRQIEQEEGVRVLLAVESGSRAWGFASPDSDFDVRFIYVRPKEDYLRLDCPRDVIEPPINDVWDLNGWDLYKALGLLRKSNPTLFEWFGSPISYWNTDFLKRIGLLAAQYYSARNMLQHYLNMGKNNARLYLGEETVRPKKYFYMLRPALACQWILERDCPPPVPFSALAEAVLPEALKGDVDRLLDLKRNGPESARIDHVQSVETYLQETFDAVDARVGTLPKAEHLPWEPLNAFFLEELNR